MLYTNSDGGARGNPGPAAIGVIIRDDKKILQRYGRKIGKATNNVAEYKALIKALEIAQKYSKEITCIVDSELIVKQLLGEYKVKSPNLLKLFLEVQKLQENFKTVKYKHTRRDNEFQKMADKIVNIELDRKNKRRNNH